MCPQARLEHLMGLPKGKDKDKDKDKDKEKEKITAILADEGRVAEMVP
jgi:hypothetical protein